MTLGAFICLSMMTKVAAPFYVALAVTVIFAAVLGIIIERVVLRPLIGEPIIAVIMVTIGLASILKGVTHMIWSPEYRSFPPIFPPQPLDLKYAIVPSGLLWGFVFAVLFTLFLLPCFGIRARAWPCVPQLLISKQLFPWGLA